MVRADPPKQRRLRVGKALLWPPSRLANRHNAGALLARGRNSPHHCAQTGAALAQVFLSYDREDGPKARVIAQALEGADHFVWWDMHIKGGAEYGREIEQALDKSDAVVVLWSERSINSAWVRDEAAAGRDKGCLIPVLLEPVTPPMGFRQYQNLDFSKWKGRGKPQRLQELLDSIGPTGAPAHVDTEAPPKLSRTRRTSALSPLLKWSLIGGAILLSLLILGPLIGMLSGGKGVNGTTTVAITAVDKDANPLARDLLVNLGRLQSAKTGSIRLVGGDADKDAEPDFIFESASDNDPDRVGASLILKDGEDKSVLWSKDFDQPSGKLADLKQQIAYTAARVLQCTLEGVNSNSRLKPQTFKDYLTACSQIDELASADPRPIIPILQKVIADAPKFEPAWRLLLLINSEVTDSVFVGGDPSPEARRKLAKLIADARKVDPRMAEASIAEISLLPVGDYQKALALADQAVAESPDNAVALNTRSNVLRRVGRMQDAVYDAERAAALDPLSPYTGNAYISALFYAGRFEAARQELAKAEQLWPGTATLGDVKFRFHLRYGDPKEALKIEQAQGQEHGIELFLNARIDRSPANLAALKTYMEKRLPETGGFGLSYALQTSGEFGWEEYLYDQLLHWQNTRELENVADIYFRPTLKKFRADPRFMQVANRAGLLEFWRRSGKWPDFCADPDLPYDCKAEAAKLG
jgi:tetratricopeptide (TPR) repeat protein